LKSFTKKFWISNTKYRRLLVVECFHRTLLIQNYLQSSRVICWRLSWTHSSKLALRPFWDLSAIALFSACRSLVADAGLPSGVSHVLSSVYAWTFEGSIRDYCCVHGRLGWMRLRHAPGGRFRVHRRVTSSCGCGVAVLFPIGLSLKFTRRGCDPSCILYLDTSTHQITSNRGQLVVQCGRLFARRVGTRRCVRRPRPSRPSGSHWLR
jgi:hypothetical protein